MEGVLDARDLYRFFHAGDDETLALCGVSMRAERSELIAVVGPSGSGKSTLLACLAGLDDPDGGTVTVSGHVLSRRPEPERAALRAAHVGVLFQSGNLLDHLTVRDNVGLAQRLAGKYDGARLDGLLEELGIASRAGAYSRSLSGGEAARAGLAVALANDPDVLLADEPSGEVDAATGDRLLELLRGRLAAGRTVVVATHSPVLAAGADRVLPLQDGRVLP
jgi:putative ABC transport system ATP-binding protein